ncbi:MAG: hypothetical protein Q4G05_04025 [Clostridia bacterium]|nr:hypothetical protein [Clostridia bacterium]
MAITQTDVTLNSKLVSTYSELIKSKTVLREVLDNLQIKDVGETELKKNITVTAVSDTELIQIAVKNRNNEYASRIANEIAEVFSKKIVEIYNISNIYVVDEAEVSELPNNINHIKDLVIFMFIGIVVSVIYVLLFNMLDNTIKSEQDIENISGLLVLASIFEYDYDNVKGGRNR